MSQAHIQLPDVTGRSDIANYSAAEHLKTLLDIETHPTPPSSPPALFETADIKPDFSAPLPRPSPAGRLLAEAFRREYSAAANDDRKRAYSTMYTTEEEDRLVRSSRAPSVAFSSVTQSDSGKKRRLERAPSQALILPGLGGGRTRAVNGKCLYGGQELGIGVIGSSTFLGEELAEQTCDIPMPEEGCNWAIRQIDGEEEGMRFMIGPHVVSLEEDLPPLAAEHPARVWNSVLHSLPAELVPTVQWKYERVEPEEEEEGELPLASQTLVVS